MSGESALVGERAELLAKVFLTRRMNVDVHDFSSNGDQGIDLICTIRDEDAKGFLPFGVMVWGTAKPVENGTDASAFARQKLRSGQETTFFMPVIAILFSMHNDDAYYCWVVEPSPESGRLVQSPKPIFRPFTSKHLDLVIRRVVDWYGKIEPVIVEGGSESAKNGSAHDV